MSGGLNLRSWWDHAILPRLRHAWRVTYSTFELYTEIGGEQRAASFAYYVLFSLFPLIALLLAIGSHFVSSQDVVEFISGFLPLGTSQQKFIWESVHGLELRRGGVSLVSVVIFLWSSLRFFLGLVRAVNRAWHSVELSWWQLPLKNLLMVAVMGSAMLIGLFAPAVLQGIRDILLAAEHLVLQHFPLFNLHLASSLLDLARYLFGGLVLFYSFTLLYMLAPRERVQFRQVWLASLLVTISLQLCQIAFVSVLPHFIDYGIYRAVGWMMLLLLWVYISGIIIILGGCLCAAMDKEKRVATP